MLPDTEPQQTETSDDEFWLKLDSVSPNQHPSLIKPHKTRSRHFAEQGTEISDQLIADDLAAHVKRRYQDRIEVVRCANRVEVKNIEVGARAAVEVRPP
jgi:hypothetical protein